MFIDFDDDFEEFEDDDEMPQDPETGVYTMHVERGHFMFYPCQCGHTYGRHSGDIMKWPASGECFECHEPHKCKKFDPLMTWEEYQAIASDRELRAAQKVA